jgi:hypothetical protein
MRTPVPSIILKNRVIFPEYVQYNRRDIIINHHPSRLTIADSTKFRSCCNGGKKQQSNTYLYQIQFKLKLKDYITVRVTKQNDDSFNFMVPIA